MTPIYEIATYSLRPGVSVEQLRAAIEPLHAFVSSRPGCMGIVSVLGEDGRTVSDVLA